MTLPARIDRKSHKQDAGKRSPGHRAWVRGHGCSLTGCGGMPIECAHVRTGTSGGMGVKPSDRWCISLCKHHHEQQHQYGEREFQKLYKIDMKALAEEFARKSPHWPRLKDMP